MSNINRARVCDVSTTAVEVRAAGFYAELIKQKDKIQQKSFLLYEIGVCVNTTAKMTHKCGLETAMQLRCLTLTRCRHCCCGLL